MTEDKKKEYLDLRRRKKNARYLAGVLILMAFIVMASWGWTPLKRVIPALQPLLLWAVLCVAAVIVFILSIIHDVKSKALENEIEDSRALTDIKTGIPTNFKITNLPRRGE
jgi:hypothetical protein